MQSDEAGIRENGRERLRNAVAGDVDALAKLIEEAAPDIRARLSIGPEWQAALDLDDVMQVTFVEAFLRIGQFAGDSVDSFHAWLAEVARHNLITGIRHLSRKKRPPRARQIVVDKDESYVALCEMMGVTTTTPSRVATRKDAKLLVTNALSHLPQDYAAAVQLFDIEGLTGPEVAERMGRSRGAVHMLRGRAHDRLRELLGSSSRFLT